MSAVRRRSRRGPSSRSARHAAAPARAGPEPVPLDRGRVRGAQHQHAVLVGGEFLLQLSAMSPGPQLGPHVEPMVGECGRTRVEQVAHVLGALGSGEVAAGCRGRPPRRRRGAAGSRRPPAWRGATPRRACGSRRGWADCAAGGTHSSCTAPWARCHSAAAAQPGRWRSPASRGGARSNRPMRVATRVCIRVPSVESSGESCSSRAVASSAATAVKLEIGVGSTWMRRAPTAMRWPTVTGKCAARAGCATPRAASRRPSHPRGRERPAPARRLAMRTRSRSTAPANRISSTVPWPTKFERTSGSSAHSSTSSGRSTATTSRGTSPLAPGVELKRTPRGFR